MRSIGAALLAGVALAALVASNALMALSTSPVWASFLTHGTGACLLALLLWRGKRIGRLVTMLPSIPKWPLIAGLVGAVLVVTEAMAVNSPLGLSLALSLFLLGQIVLSLFIDAFGFFWMTRRPVTLTGMFEVVCVGSGCALLLFF